MSVITINNVLVTRVNSTGTGFTVEETYPAPNGNENWSRWWTVWSSAVPAEGDIVNVSGTFSGYVKTSTADNGDEKKTLSLNVNDAVWQNVNDTAAEVNTDTPF